jgi:hypothetical protein
MPPWSVCRSLFEELGRAWAELCSVCFLVLVREEEGARVSWVEKEKGRVGIYGCAAGRGDEKWFGGRGEHAAHRLRPYRAPDGANHGYGAVLVLSRV